MKKILFLTVIAFISFSCQNNRKEVKETKIIQTTKIDNIDNTKKTEKLFEEFKSLYYELLIFKDKPDFRKLGFGAGGPYNKWLLNVKRLKVNPDSKLLLKKGIVPGELEQLGLEYASFNGKETELTIFFNKEFVRAISPKPLEKVENVSGNSNYEKIKTEYKLFGKWIITLSIASQKYSYPFEIYNRNNEYIGVIPEDKYDTKILEKKGNKYFVKGNEYGEYYQIDSKMNMTLFDQDGELTSMGYKAIKQ